MKQLKCWKRKHGYNSSHLIVFEKSKSLKEVVLAKEKGWNVYDKSPGSSKKLKSLKKQSQALKFSKEFMRKHDTC